MLVKVVFECLHYFRHAGAAVANKAPTLDVNAQGEIDGKPTYSFDPESAEDKPWRLPGTQQLHGLGNRDVVIACYPFTSFS